MLLILFWLSLCWILAVEADQSIWTKTNVAAGQLSGPPTGLLAYYIYKLDWEAGGLKGMGCATSGKMCNYDQFLHQ